MLQWGRNFIVAEIKSTVAYLIAAYTASMGPQLYRCGNHNRTGTSSSTFGCFNGAATLSLRKFGQGLAAPAGCRASMGPQLYRCGNWRATSNAAHSTSSFNGAATLSLRKCSCTVMDSVDPSPASMGPQLYRCGNWPLACPAITSCSRLQWGRNFIVAEIGCGGQRTILDVMLQWGRNFIVAEITSRTATEW